MQTKITNSLLSFQHLSERPIKEALNDSRHPRLFEPFLKIPTSAKLLSGGLIHALQSFEDRSQIVLHQAKEYLIIRGD
jgi:hypothetical protein